MKKLIIIADPAHGIDVRGKRSPDGTHFEYKWSRQMWASLYTRLMELGYNVEFTTTSETEPGLNNRVKAANAISARNRSLVPLLISLHNDAAGDGVKWMQARGISIWTSRGRTRSDIFASEMMKALQAVTSSGAKLRFYSPRDKDFEANFSVLTGNYNAMLIECLFQDNKEDVELLKNETFNKALQAAIIQGIENINATIE